MNCPLQSPPYVRDIYGNDDPIPFTLRGLVCRSITGQNKGPLAHNDAMLPIPVDATSVARRGAPEFHDFPSRVQICESETTSSRNIN
jgi:hypothetical protein